MPSRKRFVGLLAVVAASAVCASAFVSTAQAARVVVLGPDGRVSAREDPFIATPAITPAPESAAPPAPRSAARRGPRSAARRGPRSAAPRTTPRGRTRSGAPSPGVRSALKRLHRRHALSTAAYRRYLSIYAAALAAERSLGDSVAAEELQSVIDNAREIAAAGMLTPDRLPAIFATLRRNVQWWTSGDSLAPHQLVEFSGSQLVWEYYPGQGLELQVLATFGRADAFYTAGPREYPKLRELLAEMIPLATHRGGGLTWEYYFHFDGGAPPWTSAMSQGTGIEALTRAYRAFGEHSYLALAHRALEIFTIPPPVGVALPAEHGTWYLQYSFAPEATILNAFLQALIGLYDYARTSGDPLAARLFARGDAEAIAAVPHYDTGAWSLYQPGVEDSLGYHELVTGFLRELCARTHSGVYCRTARQFESYLKTPPALRLLSTHARSGSPITIRFRLSKYSHVGIVVTSSGRAVFETSADFGYGVDAFEVPALRRGRYGVRLAATDLAGNFSRITGSLKVS